MSKSFWWVFYPTASNILCHKSLRRKELASICIRAENSPTKFGQWIIVNLSKLRINLLVFAFNHIFSLFVKTKKTYQSQRHTHLVLRQCFQSRNIPRNMRCSRIIHFFLIDAASNKSRPRTSMSEFFKTHYCAIEGRIVSIFSTLFHYCPMNK